MPGPDARLLRRPRALAAVHAGYRVAYRLVQVWSLLARPRRRGVKCVLRDGEGRVLWVRHTYGDRRGWELPGGGARRGEAPADAARREAREELGVDVPAWRPLGAVHLRVDGMRLELWALQADWPTGSPMRPDPVEIAAAAWHLPGAPPQPVGRVTRAALPLLARG